MSGRYPILPEEVEVIQTGKVYNDGKIFLQKRIRDILDLAPGKSRVVFMLEKTRGKERIYLESSVKKM